MAITTKEEYIIELRRLLGQGWGIAEERTIRHMWNEVNGNLSDQEVVDSLNEFFPKLMISLNTLKNYKIKYNLQ